jgi:hypothetical protein
MPIIETNIRSVVELDESGKHRYKLERIWDNSKPKAGILMIYPGTSDPIHTDLTTIITTNNLANLGYGGVTVWNLFSRIDCNIHNKNDASGANLPENDACIAGGAADVDTIIIAYGKGGEGNTRIRKRQLEVLGLLEPFKDKVVEIENSSGARGFHPLHPSVRKRWDLVPFAFPEIKPEEENEPDQKKSKKKKKSDDGDAETAEGDGEQNAHGG